MFKLNRYKVIIIVVIIIIIGGGIYYTFLNKSDVFIDREDIRENNEEINNISENTNLKQESSIVVHISGAVHKEGVVKLKEGSRIEDAIIEAGGIREDAYTKDLNLAYKLEDGIKIYIPTIDEHNKDIMQGTNQNDESNVIKSSNPINSPAKDNKSKKVNINTANQAELETLPGIGASTASKIVSYREQNGKFKKIEDIKKVNGIGENKFKNIKDVITI